MFIIISDSYVDANGNDELIAIELEIAEIDEQINRLRQQRSCLIKRQQKLKEFLKHNQLTSKENVTEKWRRTGISKKTNNSKDIFLLF